MPPAGYKPSDGGGLAFRSRGGDVDYATGMIRNSWQMKCYGADQTVANAVYRALFDVLHDATGGGIRSARLEVAGQTLEEEAGGTSWPYVLVFFETWMNIT